MALHVGLGRGTAVDAGIGVDEGQVLPLPLGEAFRGHRHTIDSSAPLATERQDEHTLSVELSEAERSELGSLLRGCIRVVQDSLSTHTPGSLYEAFPAPEAHRILERLE